MIYDQPPTDDDHFWDLTRNDLDEPEQVIYDNTLARLDHPSVEQKRILAAYSWAASELKKAAESDDQTLAIWARDCMIYARNGLGIARPQFIDPMDLLLRYDDSWPPIYLSLKNTWQLPESK